MRRAGQDKGASLVNILRRSTVRFLLAAAAVPACSGLSAQEQALPQGADPITVTGQMPADLAGLPKGPEVKGMITARRGGQMQVTGDDGKNVAILVSPATQIRSSGGFLGLDRDKLGANALLNGL